MPQGSLTGWSQVLVGHQWPDTASLAELAAADANRSAVSAAHDDYAGLLESVRCGELAAQQGLTADAVAQLFRDGQSRARDIAERNRAKAEAYRTALQSASLLRDHLRQIAAEGEAAIREVLASDADARVKVERITAVIAEAQTQANSLAAQQSGNLIDAIQRVLDADGAGIHAREFMRFHGTDTDGVFASTGMERIRAQALAAVDRHR